MNANLHGQSMYCVDLKMLQPTRIKGSSLSSNQVKLTY